MREISPAVGMTPDDFLESRGSLFRTRAQAIRAEKKAGTRIVPSASLIDNSQLLDSTTRTALLDKVAELVDENLFGRAEMCIQFADLLSRALRHVGLMSRAALGTSTYFVDGRQVFEWDHAWVRIGREVVDGNVDSIPDNPMVPDVVRVRPYWGPISETPADRRLHENRSLGLPDDEDVENTWWPELREWIDSNSSLTRA